MSGAYGAALCVYFYVWFPKTRILLIWNITERDGASIAKIHQNFMRVLNEEDWKEKYLLYILILNSFFLTPPPCGHLPS